MKPALITLLVLVSAVASLSQAEPPQLQHANVINRNTADLAAEVHRIAAEKQASWIAYATPSIAPDQQMCCFNSSDGMNVCGCTLERQNSSQFTGHIDGAQTPHLEIGRAHV